MDEVGKTPMEKEAKMTKMEKNDKIENKDNIQGIEMEVIPIVTDVFTQPEDLFNMTPLKLVAAISAQHLITTVKNIPVTGNSYEDSLNMLENVVKEFNKTAEIIKLTAKYMNISGHYMLSTLKEFTKESCDVKSLDEALKSVRRSFLKTITKHAMEAVKELNEKTRQREISGSDILISSSYHIVSAFQEMTNKVLTLSEESRKKCKEPLPRIDITPPSGENSDVSKQTTQNIFSFQPIPQQGKQHKSIKKDQAKPKSEDKITQTTFSKQDQTLESANSQDLTVEFFSPETILKANNGHLSTQIGSKNQLKLPEDVTVEYIPLNSMFPQKMSNNNVLTETTNEQSTRKISKITKFEKFQDDILKNFNNQDLTVEVYSPGSEPYRAQLLDQKGRINNLEGLKMELIPLKAIFNSKNALSSEKPKEKSDQNPSTNNKIEIAHDPTTNGGDIKHKFTVEVLSPKTIIYNQKNDISELNGHVDTPIDYNRPKTLPLLQNYKNSMQLDTPKEAGTVQKKSNIDRELDSSAVDSLSNVPMISSEVEITDVNKDRLEKAVTEKLPSPKTEIFDLLQNPSQTQTMEETNCYEQLEPVCGFDEKIKKLIIFLNDCKMEAHNKIYKTSK